MPKEPIKSSSNTLLKVVIGIFILSLLFAGYTWFIGRGGAGEYEAVFLTNGQVYFGKVQNKSGSLISLTDVYYLPQTTQLQQGDSSAPAEISLIKLGKELHGPTDRMEIIRSNVLFFEELSADSKILKAIQNHKNS